MPAARHDEDDDSVKYIIKKALVVLWLYTATRVQILNKAVSISHKANTLARSRSRVMANGLDSDLKRNEFKFQSCYYVQYFLIFTFSFQENLISNGIVFEFLS